FEAMTDAIQKVPARKGAPIGKYRVALVDMHDEILEAERMARAEAAQAGPLDPKHLGALALPQEKRKKVSGSGVRVPAQYNQRLDTPFNDIEIKPGKNWFDLDVKYGVASVGSPKSRTGMFGSLPKWFFRGPDTLVRPFVSIGGGGFVRSLAPIDGRAAARGVGRRRLPKRE